MSFDKETRTLSHLIDINHDACDFYNSAAEQAENPHLVTTFTHLEQLHRGVVRELRRCIAENGGKSDAHGSLTGSAAQFFGELAAKISNDTDETLIKHLEEAEDRCLHSLEEALSKDLRSDVKTLLRTEMETLRKTHDYMKALKD
ncbi:MAG: PA2169 family four-helix-bundle protein, partial [Alphaproteobacteria bacterium]|nr:PA2169 family four-helix-bundle protein [Alphaproteobacteria bacterium]